MTPDTAAVKKTAVRRQKSRQDEKGKKKRYNIRKIAGLVLVFALVLYAGYVLIWQQFTISEKNAEIDALQQQITAASDETDRLKEELEQVNDPEYLERIAREKLGLVRANERVFVDSNKGD